MPYDLQPCVYIITNKTCTVLYIGVTSDIGKRIYEHKEQTILGFPSKYNCTRLVYYEYYEKIREALLREKHLKQWKRAWKDELIIAQNPQWQDLSSL